MSDRPESTRAGGQKAGEPAPLLPVVSLPNGGGALQGIGETFAVNPATGTCSFSVPIHAPPGRSGFGPQLALSYDSGAGNGPFGLGWGVQIPAVSRRTDRGIPRYRDGVEGEEDTFLLAGAEDLVPLLVQGPDGWAPDTGTRVDGGESFRVRRYRPRTEGLFARVERWESADTGDVHWRTLSGDNVTSLFGRTPGARIADPAAPDRVFSWLLEETRDDRGNVVRYAYRAEDDAGVGPALPHERNRLGPQANRHPKRITYGNLVPGDPSECCFEVVFDYGDHHPEHPAPEPDRDWPARADAFSVHRPGFEVRTRRLCRRVLVFHRFAELGPEPRLVRSTDFAYDERPDAARLVGVRQRGYVPGRAPDETPEVRFAYTVPVMDPTVRVADAAELPEGVDGSRWRWVDLEGEGAAGILAEDEGAWRYAPNRGGGRFGPLRTLATAPANTELREGRQQLVDLRGDGRAYLVEYAGETAGFYARAPEAPAELVAGEVRGWEPFRAFAGVPRLDWSDPNLRWVDVDGDGRADVLIAGEGLFTWYPSRAEEGFGAPEHAPRPGTGWDEERGPALVFADATESIHLADMDGDGLADIVRIRNGDVCYWPNQGHGRFGARVAMDAAPVFDHPDRWDPRRLRLADVDGTGTTDLLYLGGDRVAYWSNQAGNRWSPAREVPALPAVDSLSAVAVTDLLGSGTACLVWSSPLPEHAGRALRYVDLTGGKPHLLRAVDNGRGGETRVEYAPSTRFYLEDREAGRPWATRLPFPVQVAVRVETLDHVTGHRLVTRYAYAHGCYDGEEREFRGFGRVDQWDAEEWSGDPLDQPPVRTRSWFHTGVWNPEEGLVRRFAEEFWAGDAQAWPRPESVLPAATRPAADPALAPTELSVAELRESWRALRGRLLRQETFADDGAPESAHPYAVVEHAYEVECLQPRRSARHAVFVAHQRESRTWHYERDPADPRVQQALTLRVDEFGAVLESAAVGYPRRVPAGPAAAEQARAWITATSAAVSNQDAHPEWRRIGVPVESTAWELTGLALPAGRPLTAAALRDALAAAQEIPYEAAPAAGALQKRAVQRARRTYWRDDLSGPLPPGEAGRRALAHETYTAAFTPGLLASAYAGRVTDAMLGGEGGYRLQDGIWWARTGHAEFDPARFYLPVAAVDPWGNRSRVEYDAYSLFVAAAHDALPAPLTNTVTALGHYRTLVPWLLTDANGNRSAVRFDGLGRVVATALLGKPGAGEGDVLDLASDEAAPGDDPTTRFEYDVHAWREGRGPTLVRTLARERHRDPASRWQESRLYTDGLGREVLGKVQAEPGPAPWRDGVGAIVRDAGGRPVLRHTASRWVGTGRVVLDNKGNPVRQYEPYFAGDGGFDTEADLVAHGVTSLLLRDPLGRVVRTDLPDGTFTSVRFDPWEETTRDAADNVLASRWYAERMALPPGDPERRAAELAAAHADTPARAYLDSLGRAVASDTLSAAATVHRVRTTLDVEGNQLSLTDPRGNVVLRQTFTLDGRVARAVSADAGEACSLADATGKPLRAWQGAGPEARAFRYAADEMRRPTHRWVRVGSGAERLAERTLYGERHPEAAARNLRGQVFRVYDAAGAATSQRYDFQGNLVESSRTLPAAFRTLTDWSPLAALHDPAAAEAAARPLLEAEVFTTRTEHDALDRPVRITHPDASAVIPAYNEAGLLETVVLDHRWGTAPAPYVAGVEYDAGGRRERIVYGSGVHTDYTYHPESRRLVRLRTLRPGDGAVLQELSYTYDPVGNVVEIRDAAQQNVFFRNAVVAPSTRYVYDALYRLTRAEGREHAGIHPPQPGADEYPLNRLPHDNDARALRRWEESYAYDAAGNLLEMVHRAGGGVAWRRGYAYASGSNRLASTVSGETTTVYPHDGFGNVTGMPHLQGMEWDPEDQLRSIVRGTSRAYYLYDASGRRVRKLVEKNGGATLDERIYLGAYEIYRERSRGGLEMQRDTLHLMDGERRIALVETLTYKKSAAPGAPPYVPTPLPRYQLDNHLGSCSLELDGEGRVISYEEYYPYGSTSYRSAPQGSEVSLKRYRHTGKERDEESGFYHHGARYYVPWLGRWLSADPSGVADGPNLYAYVHGNPVRFSDPSGNAGEDMTQPAGGRPGAVEQFGRNLWAYGKGFGKSVAGGVGAAGEFYYDAVGSAMYALTPKDHRGDNVYKRQHDDFTRKMNVAVEVAKAGPGAAAAGMAKGFVAGLDQMNASLAAGDQEGAMEGLGNFMGVLGPLMLGSPGSPSAAPMLAPATASGPAMSMAGTTLMTAPSLAGPTISMMAAANNSSKGGSSSPSSPAKPKPKGAEAKGGGGGGGAKGGGGSGGGKGRGKAPAPKAKGAGTTRGMAFKAYWNLQEMLSAKKLEELTGSEVLREVELFVERKPGILEKLPRRLDALETGSLMLHEWSTVRNILEGSAKFDQLKLQLQIFTDAKANGWTIWGRGQNSHTFWDVTRAEQYIGTYLHWKQ